MLGDLGIPVEAERGRHGAYRLKPGFKLPPLMFTEDEALALTVSLLLAREHGLAQTTPAFEGALAKIERVLPTESRERIQAVGRTVVFETRSTHVAPSLEAIMLLSAAVSREQRVELRLQTLEMVRRAQHAKICRHFVGEQFAAHPRSLNRAMQVEKLAVGVCSRSPEPVPVNA